MPKSILGAKVRIVTVSDCLTKNGPGFRRTFVGRVTYVHPSRRWFMVQYKANGVILRECFNLGDVGKYVFFVKKEERA